MAKPKLDGIRKFPPGNILPDSSPVNNFHFSHGVGHSLPLPPVTGRQYKAIYCLVGRLGSEVRVSDSFQMFD